MLPLPADFSLFGTEVVALPTRTAAYIEFFLPDGFFPGVLPATVARLIEGRQPSTIAASLPIQQAGASQLERTIATLNQYIQSPAGDSSNPATEALQFLNALPQYLPAPKAAESDSGMITLFWEVDNFYADAEFHGDGKFSAFTRHRVEGKDHDEVLDEHPIEDAAGGWLATYMAPLFPVISSKAA
jgi:hypothetical protein